MAEERGYILHSDLHGEKFLLSRLSCSYYKLECFMFLQRSIALAENRVAQSTVSSSVSADSKVLSGTEAAVNNGTQVQGT